MGKGIAKSPVARLEGVLDGDLERDLIKDDGDGGVARMAAAEGDFGDDEAKRRVNVDGFVVTGKGGRSAIGICGIGMASLWSCARNVNILVVL